MIKCLHFETTGAFAESMTGRCKFENIKYVFYRAPLHANILSSFPLSGSLNLIWVRAHAYIKHSGVVLEKVAEYLCYSLKNKEATNVPDMDIPPELCLELLMAADYLDGACIGWIL